MPVHAVLSLARAATNAVPIAMVPLQIAGLGLYATASTSAPLTTSDAEFARREQERRFRDLDRQAAGQRPSGFAEAWPLILELIQHYMRENNVQGEVVVQALPMWFADP